MFPLRWPPSDSEIARAEITDRQGWYRQRKGGDLEHVLQIALQDLGHVIALLAQVIEEPGHHESNNEHDPEGDQNNQWYGDEEGSRLGAREMPLPSARTGHGPGSCRRRPGRELGERLRRRVERPGRPAHLGTRRGRLQIHRRCRRRPPRRLGGGQGGRSRNPDHLVRLGVGPHPVFGANDPEIVEVTGSYQTLGLGDGRLQLVLGIAGMLVPRPVGQILHVQGQPARNLRLFQTTADAVRKWHVRARLLSVRRSSCLHEAPRESIRRTDNRLILS